MEGIESKSPAGVISDRVRQGATLNVHAITGGGGTTRKGRMTTSLLLHERFARVTGFISRKVRATRDTPGRVAGRVSHVGGF